MQLAQILYEIKMNGKVDFLKDLYREQEVRNIIMQTSKRNKCSKKELIDILEIYILGDYVYDKSYYCEERFLNNIKKYLGKEARKLINKDDY